MATNIHKSSGPKALMSLPLTKILRATIITASDQNVQVTPSTVGTCVGLF